VTTASSSAVLTALALALAGVSCHRDVNLLGPADGGPGGGRGGSVSGTAGTAGTAGTGVIGGTGGTGGTPVNPACVGLGPAIVLPTSTTAPCAAALATRGHRFALCACDPMTAPARLRSDSYDSTVAPAAFEERAAAFGFSGNLNVNAEVRAGGALYVAGAAGLVALNAPIRTTMGSLRVGGPLSMSGDHADIDGDAYVGGNVTGDVRVNGTLHVPTTATVDMQIQVPIAREAITVAAPCDCSAGAAGFVDIAGAIATAAGRNDNASINLSPTALAPVTAQKVLELPCGTFYLNDIDADAGVTLVVHGRTLLAVGRDVALSSGLTVQLDPSAELDLLVSRWLTVSGSAPFGATGAPARFRVWVAGTDSVIFDGAPPTYAVVHAPSAPVSAPAGLPLSGSLLARSISIGADTMIHYDRAILAAGTVCGEPPATPVP
jgi:hypothetical protein